MAILSMVIVLSLIGSTICSGIADGQQYAQQSSQGNDGAQTQPSGNEPGPVIKGLEGLKGFGSGHSQLSLAVIPLSQQDNQLMFQLIGFAVSIPETGEAVIYSLETPLSGVIDPSQNTLQIDISNLADAIDTAGYDDASDVYDVIRSDPQVMIIDVDLSYASQQGSQTSFNVNSVDLIFPDGRMQTFALQKPTQLIVDTQNDIVAMVAFPEMVDTFDDYYGATYTSVEPVVYSEPVYVTAPIYTPYLNPMPFYGTGYAWYNRFAFGSGFRSFWNVDRVTHFDRFSNADRFQTRNVRNDFADRSRNTLQTAQRRGDFAQSRSLGSGVKGGIGGFRGGTGKSVTSGASISRGKAGGGRTIGGAGSIGSGRSAGVRAGGARAGGGRGGGGRRR